MHTKTIKIIIINIQSHVSQTYDIQYCIYQTQLKKAAILFQYKQ